MQFSSNIIKRNSKMTLKGDTLGQKHRYFNKLVKEAVDKHLAQPTDETVSEDDIENLLKIEVACKTRNVEFLLNIFKSEDLLYVSRAIKKSKWLITDSKYSHIVNPEFLHTQLSPEMTSKAFHKLMLSVRLTLKDENRVESFYTYIAERNDIESIKWLQHCSVPFIEQVMKKESYRIPRKYLHRLILKSISIFEMLMKCYHQPFELMQEALYLANNDTVRYLNAIENNMRDCFYYNAKSTAMIMKACPRRVLDNFEFYAKKLHLPTFVKHLKDKEDIESFLLKLMKNHDMRWFFLYRYMEHFLYHMPKETRFEFVKKVLFKREPFKDDTWEDMMPSTTMDSSLHGVDVYRWYKFAPFHEALSDLINKICTEPLSGTRNIILLVLLSCAGKDTDNVHTVLKYYHDNHINEPSQYKIQFLNALLSHTNFHEFDDETWSLLNKLFESIDVYVQSDNSPKLCIEAVIIRCAIHSEEVPGIIKDKFKFSTLVEYKTKLKRQEEKDAVFNYLNDHLITKHNYLKITTQIDLYEAIALSENHLKLWSDWSKDLKNFSYLINRVKSLMAIDQENSWNTDMKSLYNFNKVWKKVMFTESICLFPSQAVCLNALKHDPSLLTRYKNEVVAILKNDAILLNILLSKIRIYWSDSLAIEWRTVYLSGLEIAGIHKSVVTGLCVLLPPQELSKFAQKYAPSESNVDCNKKDDLAVSLQKQIAQKLSKARPLCPLEIILLYAKKDYLQFVIPSLNSVVSQLTGEKLLQHLLKLLESPVSLQKLGVRYAIRKLRSEVLKPILTKHLKSTKHSSIRTSLFTDSRALLCNEKCTSNIIDKWEHLSMSIDHLTIEENIKIYKKMGTISDIPLIIKPQYFKKNYVFLESLPAKARCESIVYDMRHEAPEVMQWLDDDFVVDVLLKNIDEEVTTSCGNMYGTGMLVAAFILICEDEATATRRYERLLGSLLDRHLPQWNNNHVQSNLQKILSHMTESIYAYNLSKTMHLPVKCYQDILLKLEASLSLEKDYFLLTTWALGVEYLKLVDEYIHLIYKDVNEYRNYSLIYYYKMHIEMAPKFAEATINLLKSHIEIISPSVYTAFAEVYEKFFDIFKRSYDVRTYDYFEFLKNMLEISDDEVVHLFVYEILRKNVYNYEGEVNNLEAIRELLLSHPSEEVKMNYYQVFDEDDTLSSTSSS